MSAWSLHFSPPFYLSFFLPRHGAKFTLTKKVMSMKNFSLLRAIIRGAWMIEPNYAEASLPIVARILNGESPFIEGRHKAYEDDRDLEKEKKPSFEAAYFCSASGTFKVSKYSSFNEAPEGSIAIHEISGPLIQEDFCGIPGTESLGRFVQEADYSSKIIAHIFKSNSPGGQVDGTETFSNIIKSTSKPSVAFITGMACSACYWSISGAKEIIASELTNTIGSIGVYSSLRDYSGYYEKAGIKNIDVYAPQSTEKNKPYRDALKGDDAALKENLSETASIFIEAIHTNRAGKLNVKVADPFKGGTYGSTTAKEIGLIDSIGDFNYAIQRAKELASAFTTSPSTTNYNANMKITLRSSMTALLGFFGFSIPAGKESAEFDVSEEKLTELNNQVDTLRTVKAELAAAIKEKETAEASLATANAALSENKIKIETLEGVIAKYGNAPGATTTAPVKEGNDDLGEDAKSIIDPNADHNQTAKRFGL